MVSGERHKVGLDYLLDHHGAISMSCFGQTEPRKTFTDKDRMLFTLRTLVVQTSQGPYGMVASGLEYEKDILISAHFTYEEGYKGEKFVNGKWKDADAEK